MFHAFVFSGTEIEFKPIKMAFSVLEYDRKQSNKTVQHAFALKAT